MLEGMLRPLMLRTTQYHRPSAFLGPWQSGCRAWLSQTTKRNDDTATAATPSSEARIRLNKWLAHQGWCSRREADVWIRKGWVRVNGVIIPPHPPPFVMPGSDHVQVVDQNSLHPHERQRWTPATIILHKPLGVVSSQPEHGHTPAIQLLTADRQYIPPNLREENMDVVAGDRNNPYRQKGWRVCGRLDVHSTGLLVLTQSGVVAQQLVSPPPGRPPVEKEYLVRVPALESHEVQDRLEALRHGVSDRGQRLTLTRIDAVKPDQWRLVLTQGRNRHIRRMFRAVDVPVHALKRVRVGNVALGGLRLRQWRYLQPHEKF